ncbi:helix-turn-helix domain-containing protein [Nonomuraea mesophila]|uniref:Helix-turn-helix domain-containing protein n=1 Tax=Nonomuraea mesophila TaxID=2530382 RepID=A0A4R5FU31_9ACTN|nr:BTAD domain-containing putative transcriptional regulator [Nonomuraea mesophila]TDE57386.1 helix-turn-helix domain-containing protein [Nonomuraea mesophila]
MVLNANGVVSVDRVITALWDEDVPSTVANQIQQMISKLRRAPGRDADRASPLVYRAPGYVLRLDETTSDLAVFGRFAERGRAALADGRPSDAARDLGAALDLWRGPALGDTTGPLILLERPRLEERRLGVMQDRIDAELALGRHTELAGALTALVAEHPLRESFRERLMLALYRSGRQAEALAEYQRLYHLLDEELGIQPCASAQQLHRQMLAGVPDPGVGPPPGPPPAAVALGGHGSPDAPVVPRHLPAATRDVTGRDDQLELLDELLPDDEGGDAPGVVISVVSGTAGIGKTALAVHWAHRVADRFPDGQLYVNLRGFDPLGHRVTPAEALRRCFDALGVPPQRIPADADAQAGFYRSLLAGKRMLVLLDDARDEEQVRPLLPAAPGCRPDHQPRPSLPSGRGPGRPAHLSGPAHRRRSAPAARSAARRRSCRRRARGRRRHHLSLRAASPCPGGDGRPRRRPARLPAPNMGRAAARQPAPAHTSEHEGSARRDRGATVNAEPRSVGCRSTIHTRAWALWSWQPAEHRGRPPRVLLPICQSLKGTHVPKLSTRLAASCVTAVTAISLAATTNPAQAAAAETLPLSCVSSAGNASAYVYYTNGGRTITKIDYYIYNSHGRRTENNITIGDSGTAPTTKTSTDSAISNDGVRNLREKNYSRGQGWIRLEVIFDVPNAGDPKCEISKYL